MATTTYITDINVNGTEHLIEPLLYVTTSSSNSGEAYTATLTNFAVVVGATLQVEFNITNKANATLKVNNSDATPIHYHGTSLTAGMLSTNYIYSLIYTGAAWAIISGVITAADTSNDLYLVGVTGNEPHVLKRDTSIVVAGSDITTGVWKGTEIAINKGGTGKTSWTQWGLVYADTTNSLAQITAGSASNISWPLISSGAAAPAWYSGLSLTGSATNNWIATFKGETDASSTTTAAVVINGGLGIQQSLHVGTTINIDNTNAAAHINFSCANSNDLTKINYINVPTNGRLAISVNGNNNGVMNTNNIRLFVDNASVTSYNNNTVTLGDVGAEWKNTYSVKYTVNNHVSLQWNSTDNSLDFVFLR